jgi:ubiquinone/menaquinone biosynthesis C-methylase UbiE
MKTFKESKHAKYTSTNKISVKIVENFYKKIHHIIQDLEFDSVIDLGCGEGHLLKSLSNLVDHKKSAAIEIDPDEVKDAVINLPNCDVRQASIYNIPFHDNSFELVICTEVLEHLDNPTLALNEISRVSSKYILLSVPREPMWCILNIMRFKYINKLGNTPGHLNHWSAYNFAKFVSLISHKFKIVSIHKPIPWTIILLIKK